MRNKPIKSHDNCSNKPLSTEKIGQQEVENTAWKIYKPWQYQDANSPVQKKNGNTKFGLANWDDHNTASPEKVNIHYTFSLYPTNFEKEV